MANSIPEPVLSLIARTKSRMPLGSNLAPSSWFSSTESTESMNKNLYSNKNDRLRIDFSVQREAFPEAQTLDPRIILIAPGSCNERHKHAHESLFVVLEGHGEVLVGEEWTPVKTGDLAFVPRWIMHQTRNTSPDCAMRVLAITDFGFTSAVLGDYDRRTRLAHSGRDAG